MKADQVKTVLGNQKLGLKPEQIYHWASDLMGWHVVLGERSSQRVVIVAMTMWDTLVVTHARPVHKSNPAPSASLFDKFTHVLLNCVTHDCDVALLAPQTAKA